MSRQPCRSSQTSLLVIVRTIMQKKTQTHQHKSLRQKKTMQQQSSSGRVNYCNFAHLNDKCWQLNVLTRLWKHQFCWSCVTSDHVEPGRLVQQLSRSQLLHGMSYWDGFHAEKNDLGLSGEHTSTTINHSHLLGWSKLLYFYTHEGSSGVWYMFV